MGRRFGRKNGCMAAFVAVKGVGEAAGSSPYAVHSVVVSVVWLFWQLFIAANRAGGGWLIPAVCFVG